MNFRDTRGVIFDLDGTLINSLQDIADSVNAVLSDCGFPVHELETVKSFIGNGAAQLIKRALPTSSNGHIIAHCLQHFEYIYNKRCTEKTMVYSGIYELLEHLKDCGIKRAVLSNKPHHITSKICDHFFKEDHFQVVFGADKDTKKKPDPTKANHIALLFQIPADNILIVGDSVVDIETGVNAGLKTIAVSWGFSTSTELQAHDADCLVSSPQELIRKL